VATVTELKMQLVKTS